MALVARKSAKTSKLKCHIIYFKLAVNVVLLAFVAVTSCYGCEVASVGRLNEKTSF